MAKLQASINQIREKEIDASKKVQRTLDVVDKTQFEKQQAEMEVYRLKSELELQHDKLLEVLSEQTRKVADERSQAERRYQQHIDRLNSELTIQRDALSKMQMEVEKHQRIEEDLKRDLNSKNLTIENVKKELNNKIGRYRFLFIEDNSNMFKRYLGSVQISTARWRYFVIFLQNRFCHYLRVIANGGLRFCQRRDFVTSLGEKLSFTMLKFSKLKSCLVVARVSTETDEKYKSLQCFTHLIWIHIKLKNQKSSKFGISLFS